MGKNTNQSTIQCIILVLSCLVFFASTANGQSATLDQGANGKRTAPVSPADWVNGNLNINQAHFLEGYSIPLRAILGDLTVNKSYTIAIGYDVRSNGKNAMDYLTHYERYEPHWIFDHPAESVDPLLNIAGFPAAYFTETDTYPIPTPSSANADVPGMPAASFNALPENKRVLTAFNADITNITYASEGALNEAASETIVEITFTALTPTVVLAWGGHLAAAGDWGKDPITGETHSASSINGSPYHTRLKYWIIDGVTGSIGNQDKSVKTDAVYIPPIASATGPLNACTATPSLTYTSTVDEQAGLTYLWSITGSNTAGAKIADPTAANAQVVPIGAGFTTGTFNLQLIVTRDGFTDTCFINGDAAPGASVTIGEITVNAGEDQSITDLETAALQASASGGSDTYSYSWSPAANLSNANIANPVFTPPSTGIFQFIVTATGQFDCSAKDTVVITVTQHVKPPCSINGANPVCPGSANTYTGPDFNVSAWLWSVSGGASIIGANNGQSVSVKADNTCGSYTLQLITTASNSIAKDTCATVILVKDAIAPVLTGTVTNQTLNCSKDIPAMPEVTATDNCDQNVAVQYSQTTSDSIYVNKYTLTRKWWAVDACGNISDTMIQIITINDDVKPVISADFNREINVQCLKDLPAPPTPTATDNCDETVQAGYSEEGSGSACDSTITRKWVFTDACGNSDEVTQTIHIRDNTIPVLVGSVSNANIICAKDIPTVATITATDNCDQNIAVKYSQATTDSTSVSNFTLTRKWWATDACGNTSDTMTQIIVVNDDLKPVITADFTKEINVQCLKDVPPAPAPIATDNCNEPVQPVYTEEGAGSACDSTIIRTWTFTDASGNSDIATQTIHIKDNTAPVLAGTATNANVSCVKDIPAVASITATDNCDENVAVQYSQVISDSTAISKFILTRKWWAVDACGNTSDIITQTIVVNDDIKPSITASFDKAINVQCMKDIPALPVPTATDNCDDSLQPVYSVTGSGTACDSTITRTWTFTDACGNSDFVAQVIHIKDDIAPVLVGTTSNALTDAITTIYVSAPNQIPAPALFDASDNCKGRFPAQFDESIINRICENKYTLVRKWWAADACGNVSDTFTQVIVVNDDIKPVITADFEKEINVQCIQQIPAIPTPAASDNSGGNIAPVYSEAGSGSAYDSTITRRWTFTDACGNSDFVTQTIHIKDTIAPVLSGSANNLDVSCAKEIPAPANITAADNCSQPVKVQYSQTTSDSSCINTYTLTRKWWAADAGGNTSDTLSQVIKVHDNVKPVITAGFTKAINVQCVKDIPAVPTPTATGNCDINLQPVYSESGSGTACDSTITRTWTFTDACGNSDFITQTIYIKDNIAPVLAGTVSSAVNVSSIYEIPEPALFTATDNCSGNIPVQYSQTTSDSTCSGKFTLVRKWWAVDACGNASNTVSQVITINDDVKPVITANFEQHIIVACVNNIPSVPVPAAIDNSHAAMKPLFTEQGAGSFSDSAITRTWMFTDPCGNSSVVTQTIRIRDTAAPVIAANFATEINVQCLKDVPPAPTPTAADNCTGNLQPAYTITGSGSACDSTITRKWTFTDASGNSSFITQAIRIKPSGIVTMPGSVKNITVNSIADIPAPQIMQATGSCSTATVHFSQQVTDSSCMNKFTLTRKWWATDNCGYTSDTTVQTITVKDNIAPVADNIGQDKTQACNTAPQFDEPVFTDNSKLALTITYTDSYSSADCPQVITRTWQATDACGNVTSVKQAITIPCCDKSICTYTQRFYATPDTSVCVNGGDATTSSQIMISAMDKQPGDSAIFGLWSTGKFFTLHLADVSGHGIFEMLPGDGKPASLKGYATYTKPDTWNKVPISESSSNYGAIENRLLTQTMTLFFNTTNSSRLAELKIEGDSLFTAKETYCGSGIAVSTAETFILPRAVVTYLRSTGQNTVQDLLNLANRVLGGELATNINAANLTMALEAINNGFDGCRILRGWGNTMAAPIPPAPSNICSGIVQVVGVYPNPYRNKVYFRFIAPVTGVALLEIWNLLGDELVQLRKPVSQCTNAEILYNVAVPNRVPFAYRLSVGNTVIKTGIVISAK